MNTNSMQSLYEGVTNIFKKAVNYKLSNIQLSRKDDQSINDLFLKRNINRYVDVKHSSEQNKKIKLSLDTSLALNLPENYLNTMKTNIKIDASKISATISKGKKVGEVVFSEDKFKKIKMFQGTQIHINVVSDTEVKRRNIIGEL